MYFLQDFCLVLRMLTIFYFILGFETKLASFYHTSMVELSELIDKCIEAKLISQEESIQYTKLLQLARHRTITSFRQVKL